MPKCDWNACVVLMACLLWVSAGCAKPAPAPMTVPSRGVGGSQAGSTTGGGAEVPMPAATEEKPAEPTPAVTEPPAATETPAEPAKPEDAAPAAEEKKPE
ncbi:MAG TPA: hypothetical protein VM165_08950 [Planctomycetaceae bacterium]|nr:hypothetical protein [Planctomycetaceae bacterium]